MGFNDRARAASRKADEERQRAVVKPPPPDPMLLEAEAKLRKDVGLWFMRLGISPWPEVQYRAYWDDQSPAADESPWLMTDATWVLEGYQYSAHPNESAPGTLSVNGLSVYITIPQKGKRLANTIQQIGDAIEGRSNF